MKLKMYIGKVFIRSIEIDYSGRNSCQEKVEYQKKIATEFKRYHSREISMARQNPVFFIEGVESKMNSKNFISY